MPRGEGLATKKKGYGARFHVLDQDASGSVTIREFIDGLLRVTQRPDVYDSHVLQRIDKMISDLHGSPHF